MSNGEPARISGEEYFHLAAESTGPEGSHGCPVCNEAEFSEFGSYEICGICGWEDDPVQEAEPMMAGGANKLSLEQARQYWRETRKKVV